MPELSYMFSSVSEPRALGAADDGQVITSHSNSSNNNHNNFYPLYSASGSTKVSNYGGHFENNGNNIISMNNKSDVNANTCGDSGEKGNEGEKWIWVLDPLTRKLRVPLSQLVHTQATATTGTVPSLCISFLEGRCRHQWCRQAHVLPSAIPQLRHEALHAPTCCRLHDDPHDTSVLTSRFKYIRVVNNNNNPIGDNEHDSSDLISTDRVAQTVGLLRFMAHSVPSPKKRVYPQLSSKEGSNSRSGNIRDTAGEGDKSPGKATAKDKDDDRELLLDLPAKLICRLHLSHRCRYLEDCNNIHICRECELRLQPPSHVMAILSNVAPGTRTITVGDTCYAATQLAVGEVTDEEFRAICDQQRHVVATRSWDASPSIAPHRSPLIYSGSGASSFTGASVSPPTFSTGKWGLENKVNAAATTNSAAHGDQMPFPGNPENGQSDGDSPIPTGALPQGGPPHTSEAVTRALRIYDVRPKAAQNNVSNNHFASSNIGGSGNNIVKNSMGGSGAKNNCCGGGGGHNSGAGAKHNGSGGNGGIRGANGSSGYHHSHGHHLFNKHTALKGTNS
ncbi:hypothetical protein C3747_7g311 [Trypanosoma cruzi]|uniref:C3H1-type domain-containing protein n=1 Tax=Trypanosoma cruzi TaxID=5693 RepID=A0A2V2XIJ1_TRYCR|nr:hypothetical protein C3747_7g311 [Trypanosoma cruzi]